MTHKIQLLGLCGSLRAGSYNGRLLQAASEIAASSCIMSVADLSDIPLYNEDIAMPLPPSVQRFREQLAQADAILCATPEYNNSISAVLKNALDWASLSPNPPFEGKPVAIISASTSSLGGTLAQYHLRQILTCLNASVLNRPEVYIARAHEKFDMQGALQDPVAKALLDQLLQGLVDAVRSM